MPAQAPVFLLVMIAMWLLVHRTTFGRSFRAIDFRRKARVTPAFQLERRRWRWFMSWRRVIAALAAIIYTARLVRRKADAGTGYEARERITRRLCLVAPYLWRYWFGARNASGVAAIAVLKSGLAHTPRFTSSAK